MVASACRGAFQVHPPWMEGDTRCAPVTPLGCAVLKAVVAHNLAYRGSLQGGWTGNVAGQHPNQRGDVMGLTLALEFGSAREMQEQSEMQAACMYSWGMKIGRGAS